MLSLQDLLADRLFLAELAKEFELLKASQADVDFDSWIQIRLRQAKPATTAGPPATCEKHESHKEAALETSAAVVADPPGQGAIGAGVSNACRHSPATPAQATAMKNPLPQEPDRLALSHTARAKTRVSGPHPPLSACLMVPGEGAAPFTAARPAMASEPKLPQPPEAAEAQPSHGPAPVAAAAAALHAALRSSAAVPHLQAAAERERRLTLSTAVAKQQVALAVDPAGLPSTSSQVVLAVQQQVLEATALLAPRQQELTHRMEQQQAMLQAALSAGAPPAPPPPSSSTPSVSAAPTAPGPPHPPPTLAHLPSHAANAWFLKPRPPQPTPANLTAAGKAKASGRAQPSSALPQPGLPDPCPQHNRRQERKESFKAVLRQLLSRPAAAAAAAGGMALGPSTAAGAAVARPGGQGGWAGPRGGHTELEAVQQVLSAMARLAPARPHQQVHGMAVMPRPARAVEEEVALIMHHDRQAALAQARELPMQQLEQRMQQLAASVAQRFDAMQQQLRQQQQAGGLAGTTAPSPPLPHPLAAQPWPLVQGHATSASPAPSSLATGLQASLQPPSTRATHPLLAAGPAPAAEGEAGLGEAELQLMLSRLQQAEQKEEELRRKWQLGGPQGRSLAAIHGLGEGQKGEVAQASSAAAGQPHASMQSSSPSEQASGGRRAAHDPVTDAMLDSIQSARRAYLHHQQLRDGELMVGSGPGAMPSSIVEDVADALLEELLEQQAQELLNICDHVGDGLYAEELE
ncbi:hypothetical protein V8C86DRAFT_11926 [Haematococcus lacustris]